MLELRVVFHSLNLTFSCVGVAIGLGTMSARGGGGGGGGGGLPGDFRGGGPDHMQLQQQFHQQQARFSLAHDMTASADVTYLERARSQVGPSLADGKGSTRQGSVGPIKRKPKSPAVLSPRSSQARQVSPQPVVVMALLEEIHRLLIEQRSELLSSLDERAAALKRRVKTELREELKAVLDKRGILH